MTDKHRRKRENRHEIPNLPLPRHIIRTNDHPDRTPNTEHEGDFEAFEESRYFFEEDDSFDFLGGRAPCHVNFEEVGEQ